MKILYNNCQRIWVHYDDIKLLATHSHSSKIMKWINLLNNHTNNNPNLLIIFEELKEYILAATNWDYLIEYNVLNVIGYVICTILNKKYVNVWQSV